MASASRGITAALRLLLHEERHLHDDELVLLCAIRGLWMMNVAGLGVPVHEKNAVMRAIGRQLKER